MRLGVHRQSAEIQLTIYVTLLHLSALTEGAITVRPVNTATQVGSNATFNCTVNTTSNHIWWTRTGSGTVTIARNCTVSSHNSRFAVGSTEPGECNLIVFSASLEDAGKYTCVDRSIRGTSSSSAARLVVLRRVTGTVNVTNMSVVDDGDRLQYRCNVTFNGNMNPAIAWVPEPTGASVKNLVRHLPNNVKLSYSVLNVTARRPEVQQVNCTVYFHKSAASHFPPSDDQTVPAYTDQLTFNAIETLPTERPNGTEKTGSESPGCGLTCIVIIIVVVVVVVIIVVVVVIICCFWSRGPCRQKCGICVKSRKYRAEEETDQKPPEESQAPGPNRSLEDHKEQQNNKHSDDTSDSHEVETTAEADSAAVTYAELKPANKSTENKKQKQKKEKENTAKDVDTSDTYAKINHRKNTASN